MENQMREDISELKVNQALLLQRQDHTEAVIDKMQKTLDKVTKGGYIFLGIYIANSVGAGDAVKVLFKAIAGG